MRTLVLAGLVAGLLALHAPAASADHADADCRFNSIHQETLTGPDWWEGHAQGWGVADGDALTVRCVILVNGVEAASTAPGAPTQTVAVTAGRISFTARDTDVVQLCPVITTRHGEERICPRPVPPQLPPQEVIDLLNLVFDTYAEHVDPALCAALAEHSPGTGPVVIEEDGDLHVSGEWVYECPPYEWQRA